ncbi:MULTISPECIES: DUF397 domain-containing protein [Streptomyces]|uniref:DUF397 domain-containing protein n=2 Tax=Streptomyces TaxID=1883 RepID=A0A7W3NRC6_STRMR|nr:DUF397 domain-containing protein [Streptomyces murinus]MBA9055376.1 hypothetical protein [Streptomyces murinus]UWW89966.1 DUF397 domain-containing protein [Streptomyces murinus]
MSTPELHWFKSSYSSSSNGNDCVELALTWHKSSYSDSSNGNDCVEFAPTPTTIHIRDSKSTEGPCLTVAPATWTAFVTYSARTQ